MEEGGTQQYMAANGHWLPHLVTGNARKIGREVPGCPTKGQEALTTLLSSLLVRSVTKTQDLGGKGPKEVGGSPPTPGATTSEPDPQEHMQMWGVCAPGSLRTPLCFCVQRACVSRPADIWVWEPGSEHRHTHHGLLVQACPCVQVPWPLSWCMSYP